MQIYTRKGDDGTTGLLYGGRVPKDDPRPSAYGAVDEAQASIGVARAAMHEGSELRNELAHLERDLWVVMSELATAPGNRHKLAAGSTLVTEDMVVALERRIDEVMASFEAPTEFVVPGEEPVAALLDVARCVVRRAERDSLRAADGGSQVVPYLNRLSDLLWALARSREGTSLRTRDVT